MKKVYCASPFFSRFQRMVRNEMISNIEDAEVFRPDLTPNSKSYDKSPGETLANKILNDNLNAIKACDVLVFPEFTNDLGTLFEVGYALSLRKPLVRYNYLTNSYVELNIEGDMDEFILGDYSVMDMSKLSSAVMLGFNYSNRKRLGYYLNGLNDNIMLKKFNRFDLCVAGNKTALVQVDVKIVNEKGVRTGEKGKRVVTPIEVKKVLAGKCYWKDGVVTYASFKNFNLDNILGDNQSYKLLYTGVS